MNEESTESTWLWEWLAWLEANKVRVIIGAVVILLAITGYYVYGYFQQQRELAANAALFGLSPPAKLGPGQTAKEPSAAQYLDVAHQYAGTAAAGRALMLAAKTSYEHGKFAEARKTFETFQANYPGSPLLPSAAFGVAACLEAENQTNKAMASYEALINRFPTSPKVPEARLAMARLYEEKQQFAQAYDIYDQLANSQQDLTWSSVAAQRKARLEVAHPELKSKPKPAPASTAASTKRLGLTNLAAHSNATAVPTQPEKSLAPSNAPIKSITATNRPAKQP